MRRFFFVASSPELSKSSISFAEAHARCDRFSVSSIVRSIESLDSAKHENEMAASVDASTFQVTVDICVRHVS